jgi:hypothetical protein
MARIDKANRYSQIIETIFFAHYTEGDREVSFDREEITSTAFKLEIALPKNLGDVIYSFRYRATLPESIIGKANDEEEWIIRPVGRSQYRFVLGKKIPIVPSPLMGAVKVPDSTPGVVKMYSSSDEQALLARVRYNRLVDIFTGVTSYSLQNHLRTTVPEMGQIETDEIYIGVDRRGAHYVFPVQAKGGTDRLNIVQIEQDIALCSYRFPGLICLAIAAQFLPDGVIVLFGFEETKDDGIVLKQERHFRLVPSEELTREEIHKYRDNPIL